MHPRRGRRPAVPLSPLRYALDAPFAAYGDNNPSTADAVPLPLHKGGFFSCKLHYYISHLVTFILSPISTSCGAEIFNHNSPQKVTGFYTTIPLFCIDRLIFFVYNTNL